MTARHALRGPLAALLAAVALVLAPTVAHADHRPYHETGPSGIVVTDSNPEACEPFRVIVKGTQGVSEVTLIAVHEDGETREWTKDATAGTTRFTISLCTPGVWRLVAQDQDGEVLGESTVRVAGSTANSVDNSGDVAGTGGGNSGGLLPATGSAATTALLTGSGLLLLAGGVLLLTRRRMTTAS